MLHFTKRRQSGKNCAPGGCRRTDETPWYHVLLPRDARPAPACPASPVPPGDVNTPAALQTAVVVVPLVASETRQWRRLFTQTKYCQNLLGNAGEPHQQVFRRLRCARSCLDRRKESSAAAVASAAGQREADQGAAPINTPFSPHRPRLSLLRGDCDDRRSSSIVESSVRNLWQRRTSRLASARLQCRTIHAHAGRSEERALEEGSALGLKRAGPATSSSSQQASEGQREVGFSCCRCAPGGEVRERQPERTWTTSSTQASTCRMN